jgi:hypothetical protein
MQALAECGFLEMNRLYFDVIMPKTRNDVNGPKTVNFADR